MSDTKKLSLTQNAALNSIGIIFYCLCQWVATMIIARQNYSDAGIFQLAISVCNIFYTVSTYNLRTFQVSDIKNEYTPNDYIASRIITSAIAFILCLIYATVTVRNPFTILCIACYMLFKITEAFADVLHAIDQKVYRMDYVAVSNILRGISSIISFYIIIKLTQNLLLATLSMAICGFIIVFIYDSNKTSNFYNIKPHFNRKKLINLLIKCLPSVIASTSFIAVSTIPRQFLESTYGENILGYYATVATPIVIIQVLATSIFNPILTDLSVFYDKKEVKSFYKLLIKTFILIIGFAIVAYIGSFFVGEFALTLVYGESIREHTYLMYGIIGCTVLYAACWLCANILIIMRKLKTHMIISIISLLLTVATSRLFISSFYMNGVSFCIITSYLIYIAIETTIIIKNLKKAGKESEISKQ